MENDIYQVYEDEIHSLEEEIEMLTQKFENNEQESTFYSDEEIQVSGKSHQGDSKWHESPPDLKPELECLKSDLSFLMKFTGIWFTNYSKETVEKTGNKIIQKHRLSGNCCSLPFQMEFQLLEIQDDESIPAVVTDLSIIMECGEYSDLSKFVSCAEEQGSLLQFFRSLSFFAEWYEHRKCTFQHFKDHPSSTYRILKTIHIQDHHHFLSFQSYLPIVGIQSHHACHIVTVYHLQQKTPNPSSSRNNHR
uniref:Centromere protein P n=1 Tax=Pelodiscus sinensis TaxID=13735 RepID=K7G5U9_PELSI|nr:centromere protein P isoform X3 [Pelodiscus sinensis]|eukprot:XP_006127628.1 centromere protein P isoform X3 [Pelodiscus sinensis]